MSERACGLERAPIGPTVAPPLSRVCSFAYGHRPDHRGCPPTAFSHPTYSRIRRCSAASLETRLPMELAKEAVMHIAGSIKVGMALVVASGAEKEFAPFACDALPGSGH